jgi:hypothetical protein
VAVAAKGERRHARLGPSSSDIWLSCLAAPAEWRKYPPRQVGEAAWTGTLAHALCEGALQIGAVPWKPGMVFPVEGHDIAVTDEMLDGVRLYTQMVSVLRATCLWHGVETEVSLADLWEGSEPPEHVYGTADFAAADTHTLYILDFKYGRHRVNPERNTQLLCYGVGVLLQLQRERPDLADTLETVVLAVVQPRGGGDPVRQWALPISDLLYWAYSTLRPSIDSIVDGDNGGPQPELTPGNHCFFCTASMECEAYRKLRTQRSIDSFPDWSDDI